MTKEEILSYLKFGDSPPKIWRNFVKAMNLKDGPVTSKKVTRFPVKIKRETSPRLYSFTDYFIGFTEVKGVRELFGDSTDRLLGKLKVEFIDSPFPTIYPSEEDGHLIVASQYFRTGSLESIYLDVILSLNVIKNASTEGAAVESPDALWNSPGMLLAHSRMVKEARKLGMRESEILTHLRLPSFMMTPSGYRKFLKAVGIRHIELRPN
jgi:hypothetical protein